MYSMLTLVVVNEQKTKKKEKISCCKLYCMAAETIGYLIHIKSGKNIAVSRSLRQSHFGSLVHEISLKSKSLDTTS
jgi:hypothetical protein